MHIANDFKAIKFISLHFNKGIIMRGVVVTGLKSYIETNYSLALWNEILESKDQQDLLVMVAEHYKDEEVIELILSAAQLTNHEVTDFIEKFGCHLFTILAKYYNFILLEITSYDQLLNSLDDIIHPQVKKLHPDAMVPIFSVSNQSNGWEVIYESERKLCPLAIGLLDGAAKHFNEEIDISHSHCMFDGEQECIIHVTRK